MNIKICLILAISLFCINYADPAGDACTIPGWPENYSTTYGFDTFSGYLQTSTGGNIHYVFLQQQNPMEYPLVLWLNGGPGCSSMLGLLQEIGPFMMIPPSQTFNQTYNQYSWLQNSNLLFIEAPVGVGFSYTNNPNYQYNDNNTAADSYAALKNFFLEYPQYKNHEFWITGESYAGMYVPFLATYILQGQASGDQNYMKLIGLMIGNGILDPNETLLEYESNVFFDQHQFFGPELSHIFNDYCPTSPNGPSCLYFNAEVDQGNILVNINPYDVYGYCFGGSGVEKDNLNKLEPKPRIPNINPIFRNLHKKRLRLKKMGIELGGNNSPCSDDSGIEAYLNNQTTKAALNVETNIVWEACNDTIFENYVRYQPGSISLMPFLISSNLQILIYSGTSDAVVPYTYTENNIETLMNMTGGTNTTDWTQWDVPATGQVGGFAISYTGISYATVRAAGHEVPQYQPAAAFYMFNQTLENQPL